MENNIRKRYFILIFSIIVLCFGAWFALFLQSRQHLIGGGINRTFLFLLINAHLILSVFLLYLIIRQSIKLYIERRQKTPGAAFKRNLLFAFIIFSVIPVSFVFFIAGKLITTSIDNWFQVRIGAGLQNSLQLHEQQTKDERKQIFELGSALDAAFAASRMPEEGESFQDLMLKNIDGLKEEFPGLTKYSVYIWGDRGSSFLGSVSDEVNVWRKFRKVNDRTTKSLRKSFFSKIDQCNSSGLPFDFYGSLYWTKKLSVPFIADELFCVLVHRYPPSIRYPLIEIENAIFDYSQLKHIKNPVYWNYFLTFLLITLLVLFLSIWCAFFLARGISKPIQELLLAMRRLRRGELDVRVPVESADDLKPLVTGFNEMSESLQRAYRHLEFHNKEMLTMLKHIKESVFFINNYGRILSFNDAARGLVEQYLKISRFKNKRVNFLGEHVKGIFFSLVRKLRSSDKKYLSNEISFTHDGESKVFMIYVSVIENSVLGMNRGLLIVVEDLSDVYKMNKIKTWQKAAKQMAHEIKNPLTPIQLATQRLQRKLRKSGADEPVLMDCAETILHQVKIIKDLVRHFSEFAKMPDSKIEQLDINDIIKEVSSLYEMSYPQITFFYELQKFLPAFKADKKKMKRVVVNLLDNSVRILQDCSSLDEPTITIKTSFKSGRNQIELLIADNGPGIPKDVRNDLFLPYVSSGSKNMGLGLAIVHDIIAQAGGSIKLMPSSKGAVFQILLPV